MAYHFVCHHKEIKFFRDGSNCFQFLPRENLSYGVVWCIDDNHLCTRRDGPTFGLFVKHGAACFSRDNLPEFVDINSPIITRWIGLAGLRRMQWDVDWRTTIERDRRQVLIEERFEHNHFIAVLQECRED